MANRWGNSGNSGWLYFGGAPKSLQMVTSAMKLKDAYSLKEKLWPTSVHFSSVAQSCPTLCDPVNRSTPGLPAITNSQSLPKLMSIESVMPSNHLILCRPLLLLPPIPPTSGSFPMIQLFAWGGKIIRVSASASVLPMNTQDWSPSGWTGWISLQSNGTLKSLLQHHSSKASSALSFLHSPTLTSINDYWKNHSLD